MVELLDLRQGGLAQTLDGGFPELRTSVWQSEGSVQSAVQVLTACHCAQHWQFLNVRSSRLSGAGPGSGVCILVVTWCAQPLVAVLCSSVCPVVKYSL